MKRHIARPGPAYWDWRCLDCGMEVEHTGYHLRWWETVNWWDVLIFLVAVCAMVYGWTR